MKRIPVLVSVVVCATGTVMCGKDAPTSVSPSATKTANASAGNPDGSMLKITAPVPQSPTGGQRLEQGAAIPLIASNAVRHFADFAVTYRFRVFNAGGTMVAEAATIPEGTDTTTYNPTTQLEGDQIYSWQVRAEAQGEGGPWSALATFLAPSNTGYVRGNELYDPLISGVTIGEKHGPLTFIPGVGVRLETQLSYISYQLSASADAERW
jgi:hypothetical protein